MRKAVILSLREARESCGLDYYQLATKAQASDKTLRMMEAGKPVGLPICQRVARALRLPASVVQEVVK